MVGPLVSAIFSDIYINLLYMEVVNPIIIIEESEVICEKPEGTL